MKQYKISLEVFVHEEDKGRAYARFLTLMDTGFIDEHSYDLTEVGVCTCEGDEASNEGNPDHLCESP
ncbi:hypothetical protein LCGC14_1345740 [marine sediment metagenome]|uniref:Uncharacterized protein n=1 Tax=marine sediment metagenome TaxID=412755 RepID=A0A0F9NES5_9ZZZZ